MQPLSGIGDMVSRLPHIHAIAATTATQQVDILTKTAIAGQAFVERGSQRGQGAGSNAIRADMPGSRSVSAGRSLYGNKTISRWFLHGSACYVLAAWLAGIPSGSAGGSDCSGCY
ncbi:MAG: hypothetical protein IPK63_09755 [Candidatus Competibacteraceae bacterium]|nr:hypothetical protein [Candidatus Competibacteraceae bacterium]